MLSLLAGATLALNFKAVTANLTFQVPSHPGNALKYDDAPIGLSFEFFMWPSYMTNITPPVQCWDQFNKVYNKKMPVRIGGTTQDRATYDPDFKGYVSYHVDDPLVAPMKLTYGPKFFDLIPKLGAETMLGFNRGDNNRTNTYEAAKMAKSKALKNLWAVELGNEPDVYRLIWQKPVATDPWNEETEGADAANWAQGFINSWKSPLPILVGGSYAVPSVIQPGWPNTDYLIDTAYNETIKAATKAYNSHIYRFFGNETTLPNEMNHASTVKDLVPFANSVAKAKSVGRRHFIGETNLHADDTTQDRTFGAALATVDKSLRALSLGVSRLFYHQGTINQAYFNWWSDNQINAPMYGGYFAALAVADGEQVLALDKGTNSYAQYVIYNKGKPVKIVLINTDYYSGQGARNETAFTITGLKDSKGKDKIQALRMTAANSEVYLDQDARPNGGGVYIGGQYFSNSDCSINGGARKFERPSVKGGSATFTLKASEALLIYL